MVAILSNAHLGPGDLDVDLGVSPRDRGRESVNEPEKAVHGKEILGEIHEYFSPVPVKQAPLFTHEVLGRERLEELANALYMPSEDPAALIRTEKPYSFEKHNGWHEVRLNLPFATRGEIGLFKKGDELVVEVGSVRRHVGLPTSMAALVATRARLENKILTVELREPS